jgi:hypothetical protein
VLNPGILANMENPGTPEYTGTLIRDSANKPLVFYVKDSQDTTVVRVFLSISGGGSRYE